jgi:hypothetical protein
MSTEKEVYGKSPPSTPLHDDTHLKDPEETLHRDLKARQISMIALGGAVGTGYIWFPLKNSKFEANTTFFLSVLLLVPVLHLFVVAPLVCSSATAFLALCATPS